MRVLVTGRGSIARRHAIHLRALVPNLLLAVISSTDEVDVSLLPCTVFGTMEAALRWEPEAVVIASISSRHAHELEICLRLRLPCLVEKPLVISRNQLERLLKASQQQSVTNAIVVGCNLRYLPALQKFKNALSEAVPSRVLRAHLEVGQALSQWRPSRDLKTSYSADTESGGGVVFDLVHEIDMARWLLGPLQVHAAIGGHFSDLPIQSDDVHVALLKTQWGTPVVVSLDYISQKTVRMYTMITESGTFSVDIMGKSSAVLTDKGRHVIVSSPEDFDISKTYELQMRDWLAAIQDPSHKVASCFDEGLKTATLMLDMKQQAMP